MNLAAWAERNGVARVTAYRWFHAGLLPVPARKVGRLILVDESVGDAALRGRTAVYTRVSSADQKSDLDRQVARVTAWATAGAAVRGRGRQTRRGPDRPRGRLSRQPRRQDRRNGLEHHDTAHPVRRRGRSDGERAGRHRGTRRGQRQPGGRPHHHPAELEDHRAVRQRKPQGTGVPPLREGSARLVRADRTRRRQ